MKHGVLNFDLLCFLMNKLVPASPAGTVVINQGCGLQTLVFLAKHPANIWVFTNHILFTDQRLLLHHSR